MFEVTWENCKNCDYCNTENGQSDWHCGISNEQYSEVDDLPCKQAED